MPVVVFWIGLVVGLSVFVPSLDKVAKLRSVGVSPSEAPSMQSMKRAGKVFHEFDSDSVTMIVLEGDHPLGDNAHHFYDQIVHMLEQDHKHIQHVQDFWGDPLTAAGSQSPTAKPPTCRCISLAIRVRAWLTNPSPRSARPWAVCPRRRESKPM